MTCAVKARNELARSILELAGFYRLRRETSDKRAEKGEMRRYFQSFRLRSTH